MSELIINGKTVGFYDKPWDGDIPSLLPSPWPDGVVVDSKYTVAFCEAMRQKIFDKKICENAYSWVPEDYDFKEADKSFNKWRKRLDKEKNNG